jgi:NTP pyrophosphatase (non-canonical NTP hydrolase)
MNKDLLSFIQSLSKNDKKTLAEKGLKTVEEVGELAKAILPYGNASGTRHRFVTRQQILENSVDTILCALSIAYDLGYTHEQVEKMMDEKSRKWSGIQAKEDKVTFPLPFEIHITVNAVDEFNSQDDHMGVFVCWCQTNNVKPIILDLERKNEVVMVDYMTSSVHYGDNNTAMEEAKRLASKLSYEGFKVLRVKIETVPWHPAAPVGNEPMPKDSYFESHLRIVTTENKRPALLNIATLQEAHLSRNYFKKLNNGEYIIMMTLRSYTDNQEQFKKRVDLLKGNLFENGFVVDKAEIEFSVYDSNTQHDTKWILG